jgi:hypothetical protein
MLAQAYSGMGKKRTGRGGGKEIRKEDFKGET